MKYRANRNLFINEDKDGIATNSTSRPLTGNVSKRLSAFKDPRGLTDPTIHGCKACRVLLLILVGIQS